MIIRWRIKSRDCSIELLMVCWQNDIAQICQNGLRRCCLVEEHAPQRSVPHNAAFWGVFYNRSSAVVVNALMSRGRRANPVLTYETALRRFSSTQPLSTTALRRFPSVDVSRSGGWHVCASCAICSSKRLRTSLVILVFVLMIRKTLRYCLP